MALLIRGGTLITMAEEGRVTADAMISHGRILRIAEHTDESCVSPANTFDARGLTILPGLINACMSAGGMPESELLQRAMYGGVTAGLVMPVDGDVCRVMASGGMEDSRYRLIDPTWLTDEALADRIAACRAAGCIPACPVNSENACTRVLSAHPGKGALLLGMSRCEALAGRIAESEAMAVVSTRPRADEPWSVAAALIRAGVRVAFSCGCTTTGMARLPAIAGMLRRAGIDGERALRCITCDAAELIGMADRGRIAPGSRADLAFYDGDPLLTATSLMAVMADGRFVRGA